MAMLCSLSTVGAMPTTANSATPTATTAQAAALSAKGALMPIQLGRFLGLGAGKAVFSANGATALGLLGPQSPNDPHRLVASLVPEGQRAGLLAVRLESSSC